MGRLLAVFSCIAAALAIAVPVALAADETGAFVTPVNGDVLPAGGYSLLADVGPGSALSAEVRSGVSTVADCDAVTATLIPFPTPPGSGPQTLTCNLDTDSPAEGSMTLELWVDEHGSFAKVAGADITIGIDRTAPAGGSIIVPNGDGTAGSVDIGYVAGTDANPNVLILERRSTTITGGTCDAFGGAFSVVNSNMYASPSPWTDTGTADGNCYEYRAFDVDKAGNSTTYTSASVVRVVPAGDTTPPTVPTGVIDDLEVATGTDVDATASAGAARVTWTASTDAGSGMSEYDWCIAPTGATDCSAAVRSGTVTHPTVTALSAATPALADGTTYASCVRARDLAGNPSAYQCSDEFTVTLPDTTPPTDPTGVIDDLEVATGADVDASSSTGAARVSWTASTDASGIQDYDWCIAPTGASDCSAQVRGGTVASPAVTALSAATPALVDGTTYASCVRARDNAGNVSGYACSDEFTVDATVPTVPTGVIDDLEVATGADIDVTNSTGAARVGWTASTDAGSGMNEYDWCIAPTGASDCSAQVRGGTAASPAVTALSAATPALADGTTYASCVRARDNAGNVSGYACSDEFTVDATAPTVPTGVIDDLEVATGTDVDTTTSTGAARVSWTASTDASGIQDYDWCIAPTGASDCSAQVRGGTVASPAVTALSAATPALVDGTTYASCVRARDNAGNVSGFACSDGFTVTLPDTTAPTVPATVIDDLETATGKDVDSTTSIGASRIGWTASTDAGSGIMQYDWCIAPSTDTTCSTPLRTGSAAATATGVLTPATPDLSTGTTYVSCVRATDNAGNSSAFRCSNGFVVTQLIDCSNYQGAGICGQELTEAIVTKHKCGVVGKEYGLFIVGGPADDTLDGTPLSDCIRGGDGDDTISGDLGSDDLAGEAGDDFVQGGPGNDEITGGAGFDVLRGNAGADRILGLADDDDIDGSGGSDELFGGPGDDFLDGGSGADRIRGGDGNDRVKGFNGDDDIKGGPGDDRLQGQGGNDEIRGNRGNDTIKDEAGTNDIRCGRGIDKAVTNNRSSVARNCETIIRNGRKVRG